MKKKLIIFMLLFCLAVMPVTAIISTQPAQAAQEVLADFSSGRTLKAGATTAGYAVSLKKGQKLHIVAKSTCKFLVGINYLKDGTNYGFTFTDYCNKYCTVPKSGNYRIFLNNPTKTTGTITGKIYILK